MNSPRKRIPGAMVLCLAGLLACGPVLASTVQEKPVVSSWETLIPADAQDYEDPFLSLEADQLYTLSRIARLLDRGVSVDDGSDDAAKLRELEAEAREKDVDVDYLLSMRSKITELRTRAATAANEAVAGQRLSLAGFAVPGQPTEDGQPTIYLVPERGMCSHVPPPNPNQMVRITIKPEDVPQYLHQPVLVSGPIETKRSRVQQYVLDGPVLMDASYSMTADDIEYFGKRKTPDPVTNGAESGKNFFKQLNEKQRPTTD